MQNPAERVCSLIDQTRAGNAKQARFSLVISVLLAALLAFTTWPSLRPGLIVLLAGYLGSAIWLLYRNRRLARKSLEIKNGLADASLLLSWFDEEDRFLKWSAWPEALVRAIGFFILAYGFWLTTRSQSISLLLGLAYPAFIYFGALSRARHARRNLQIEKQAMAELLNAGGNPPY